MPASQMVLQTQSGESHFGHSKISAHERLGGASFPYLQTRVCAPLTSLPTGIHGGAKSSAGISRAPLSEAAAYAAEPPLAVRSAEPFSARRCVSECPARQIHRAGLLCRPSNALSAALPSTCSTAGTCLHTALTS